MINLLFKKKQYEKALYYLTKLLCGNLQIQDAVTIRGITDPQLRANILMKVYTELIHNKSLQTAWRGEICIRIAICLNNITMANYLPDSLISIKIGLLQQKMAIKFFYLGMKILNEKKVYLAHDTINEFNLDLCIIELNYVITLCADINTPPQEEIEIIYEKIINRLEALLRFDPTNPKYLNIKITILKYMGDDNKAARITDELIKEVPIKSIHNIGVNYLKNAFKDQKHIAMIYTT